jgi:hypothetical protein
VKNDTNWSTEVVHREEFILSVDQTAELVLRIYDGKRFDFFAENVSYRLTGDGTVNGLSETYDGVLYRNCQFKEISVTHEHKFYSTHHDGKAIDIFTHEDVPVHISEERMLPNGNREVLHQAFTPHQSKH